MIKVLEACMLLSNSLSLLTSNILTTHRVEHIEKVVKYTSVICNISLPEYNL